MSHLADPGNAGDAYQLGYGHGYRDGRLAGLAEARTVAQLLVDGMTPEQAVTYVEDERDAAESERRAAEDPTTAWDREEMRDILRREDDSGQS